MRESFNEYKSTIEDNLINFSYLYDGDVIDSDIRYYREFRNNEKISPSLIINCIKQIYDESIEVMLNKEHKKVNIVKENNDGLSKKIIKAIIELHKKNFDPTYVFTSDNVDIVGIKEVNDKRPFPSYFYKKIIFTNFGFDVYKCPLIIDHSDDVSIYITDKSIQSLVYSIQNMEYKVEKISEGHEHTIKYNFYNCDYNVYKINIKDLSKIRDEKISNILNGEDN
jgi:hypothetical protein